MSVYSIANLERPRYNKASYAQLYIIDPEHHTDLPHLNTVAPGLKELKSPPAGVMFSSTISGSD